MPLNIVKYLRIDEWFFSVLPLVLSAPLYWFLETGQIGQTGLWGFAFFALFSFSFLSFGYLINDYFDMDDDLAAGKEKVITGVPKWASSSFLIILVVVGFVFVCAGFGFSLGTMALTLATYFLGAAYSLPGIRLKTKGVVGLVVSSFAQRGMPIIVAASAFSFSPIFVVEWVVLSFLNGFRYILIHQLLDKKNDLVSGTRTFATAHNDRTMKMLIVVVVCVELVLIVPSVVMPIWKENAAFFAVFLVLYVLLSALLYAVFVVVFGKRDLLFTYDLVPLESFFNVFVPLCSCACLFDRDLCFAFVAACFALAGLPSLASKLKNLKYLPQVLVRFASSSGDAR